MGMVFLTGTATNAASSLMEAVTTALGSVLEWFGLVITALMQSDGALNALWPLVGIGIAFGLVYGGIRIVSRFAPGL